MNRMDYMEGKVTHEVYYRAMYQALNITEDLFDPDFLRACQRALDMGDKHLNHIDLVDWDNKAYYLFWSRWARNKVREFGDTPSISCGVCALKAFVRDWARGKVKRGNDE